MKEVIGVKKIINGVVLVMVFPKRNLKILVFLLFKAIHVVKLVILTILMKVEIGV